MLITLFLLGGAKVRMNETETWLIPDQMQIPRSGIRQSVQLVRSYAELHYHIWTPDLRSHLSTIRDLA
jgi:hypothetical protein